MIKMLTATAALLAAQPAGAAVVREADGTHTLTHEIEVDAPPGEVWRAIASAEGWKSWAVPVAWTDPADPEVIETSYDPAAKPGAPATIRQRILARVPNRALAFRTIKAPAAFPDFDTFAKVTSLFELAPLPGERTRVRLTGAGYADTDAGRRLLAFFDRGNAASLEMLRKRFARPAAAPAPAAPAGLAAMAFLIGHCWRGEMKGGAEQDTHCFDSVYGGQHIRDRHEVTGAAKPYAGETIYSWNAKVGRVEYTYWNSAGGVSQGTMVPKGNVLDFGDETYTGRDGRQVTYSTLWRRIDERTYEAVTTSAANPTGDRLVRFTRVD